MNKILVTGGHGFIGKRLVAKLNENNYVCSPTHYDCDLTEKGDVFRLFDCLQPTHIYHLAGYNGGIDMNINQPFDIFIKNTQMAANLLHCASYYQPIKILSLVASCAYPDDGAEILYEENFMKGEPNDTVIGHAYAKRNLQMGCSLIKDQDGVNAVTVCPTTIYGNDNRHDLHKMKVVDSMFHRLLDAKKRGDTEFHVWGTGRVKREVLYVDDAVALIIKAMELYNDSDMPLNLGTGQELSIDQIFHDICNTIDYHPLVRYDTTRPDGQSRKRLSIDRMTQTLGAYEFTPFAVGLNKLYTSIRG